MRRLATIAVGTLVGVGATLVLLQIWGTRLDTTIESNAQPAVLRALALKRATGTSQAPALTQPWFPGGPSAVQDNWTVESPAGGRLRMKDLHGKAVFLNFWNTSCVPCIEEMGSIQRLQESLAGNQVAFLLVTPDKRDTVTGFLSKTGWRLPVFLYGGELPSDLVVQGYPTTYILDARGSIVYEHVGAANWDGDEARRFIEEAAK